MQDKKEESNIDNTSSNNGDENIPEFANNPENKSSSNTPDDIKPKLEEAANDLAVNDVVRQESDEVLAAEDNELAKAFVSAKLPWYKKIFSKKRVWIPLALLTIVIIIFAIPYTRYKILGKFIKQNEVVTVIDSQTHQPIADAQVSLSNASGVTNNTGKLTLRVPVGNSVLTVTKRYYKANSQKVLIPLRSSKGFNVQLIATGRQVPLKVINKITGLPIANATVAADGTSAKTSNQGTAYIVLPANKTTSSATITAAGTSYNKANVTIKISTNPGAANTFALIPSGKVYFLSNATGKIDVVSSNLDGSDRQTIVAGTGHESSVATQLTNSTDWKYLALLATRTSIGSDHGTLYLVDSSNGSLITITSGINNYISMVGWTADDHLIYTVTSATQSSWQSGGELLESYNPTNGKSITLDQTAAAGTSTYDYAGQIMDNEFILPNNQILYTKYWTSSYPSTTVSTSGKNDGIYLVSSDGSTKNTVKSSPADFSTYINIAQNKPTDYYISVNSATTTNYYEYVDGALKVAPSNVNSQTFNNYYTGHKTKYYLSPDGTSTAWKEVRDGNSVLYSGDSSANNPKQLASLASSYDIYGWFGNSYVLVQKSGSELFVMPKSGLTGSLQPLKVTDYFTPTSGN